MSGAISGYFGDAFFILSSLSSLLLLRWLCYFTMLLPAVYVAEGKLLVELQQIPTELVRSTITASAKQRIQVIEQRIMTRENLLALADKYQMFAGRRQAMSGTEISTSCVQGRGWSRSN